MKSPLRPLHAHAQLSRLFAPRSIAVVGVSAKPNGFGSATLLNLSRFNGTLYAVNPRYTELHGHPCHRSIRHLPEVPDCVFLAVPRDAVEAELKACVAQGVGGVVIYASGYKETGLEERARQEARLAEIVRGSPTRVLGPNCLGFVNLASKANGSFTRGLGEFGAVPPHAVGLISQSGAIGFGIAQSLLNGLALSHLLTAGNCCDVDIADEIAYLAEEEGCRAIACLFEGTPDPARLVQAGELAQRNNKPLVVCKIGVGAEGAAAAMSHTGSLAGSAAAWRALFHRIGATVVDDVEDLLEVAAFLAKAGNPTAAGVGVLAASGGAAIICADKAEAHGVALPQPSSSTQSVLEANVPEFGAARNPCDATAMSIQDPATMAACAGAMLQDPGYAALVMPFTAANATTTPQRVAALEELAREHGKMVCVTWMAGWLEGPGVRQLQASPYLALFRSPRRCFLALAAWQRWAREASNPVPPHRPLVSAEARGRAASLLDGTAGRVLTERRAKQVLGCYGVPVTAEHLSTDAGSAIAAARRIGYPVAMKIESDDILHKTESGAVRLDVRDDAAVAAAFDAIVRNAACVPGAVLSGVLVQAMAPRGIEVIVGARIDPLFGPLIMVGLGGVLVELIEDTVLELAPVSMPQARAMLSRLRANRVLSGYRGAASVDLDRLADAIVRLSEFSADHLGRIDELDVNPLICNADSVVAVDALVIRRNATVARLADARPA